jgi:type II secretory pathway pseudopilin PulG
VVLALLAILSLSILPALGNARHKGGRMQCAANLRQLGMATMLYANDYRTWLPIWMDSSHPRNQLYTLSYTRYLWMGVPSTTQALPRSYTNSLTQLGGRWQNSGYLYAGSYLNDPNSLYCPAMLSTGFGADSYTPLLATDSFGIVRSSYAFNPRTVDAAAGNCKRRYEKTGQLEPHKLLAVDYPDAAPEVAHLRERGWNVLFTDGGVSFSRSSRAWAKASTADIALSQSSSAQTVAEQFFDLLEQDQ